MRVTPSVSPDGRRVVFTTNHRGTTYLMIADVVPASDRIGAHRLSDIRGLVTSETFDQAYTPRWAPDNRHVAYSVWQRGGYRDIRIVDAKDGSFVEVTHDRAIDGDPVFSPDGRWLYYHSDRTGITNVYAYEVATGRLRQVTNVVNGAYQPEPSPDGKWLAYVGYTHAGYDAFVMPIDESRWLDVIPYEETRPAPTPEDPPVPTAARPYNPLLTLLPRSYSVQISPGNFGQESILTAAGSDIAGLHEVTAALSLTTEFEHPEVEGSLSYAYHRIPFDVGISAFRTVTPAGGYAFGRNTIPVERGGRGGQRGHQLRDAPRVRRAELQPVLLRRPRRRVAPPARRAAQSVRHADDARPRDARLAAPRVELLERGGVSVERQYQCRARLFGRRHPRHRRTRRSRATSRDTPRGST